MSWSFEFVARNKAAAKTHLASEKVFAPDIVKEFVGLAIDGLPDDERVIHVKSNGHLCTGPGSYEVTTQNTTVAPLATIVEPVG